MTERLLRLGRMFVLFVGLGLWLAASPVWAAPSAALIMDARTGEAIYEQNADARLHPASLTKMMTLYIAFQEIEAGRLSLDGLVTISKHAAAQPPSRLGLKPGQKIALRYLIRGAAVKSANDAATAIGELIGGSEAAFAQRMTATARAMGMRNTTFRNANGLTAEGHLSTARDMSILGRHLFYDFPQYYGLFSQRSTDAGVATVHNSNTRFLDAYPGADGIKTGFTVAAGFNLTASAQRGGKRLIVTVLGAPSTAARNAKVAELLDRGFGQVAENVRVRKPAPAPLLGDVPASAPAVAASGDEAGGAGKTVRVSGAVERSISPRPRPAWLGNGPDATALAIAEDVASSLGQVTETAMVEPPPAAPAAAPAAAVVAVAAAEAPPPAPEALPDPAPAAPEAEAAAGMVAEAPAAPPPVPGTLEAQALALATDGTGEPALPGASPVAADPAAAPASAALPALPAGQSPPPRPEGMAVALASAPASDPASDPAGEPEAEAGPAAADDDDGGVQPGMHGEAGTALAALAVPSPGEAAGTDAPPARQDAGEPDATLMAEAAEAPAPASVPAPGEQEGATRHAPIFETVASADSAPQDGAEERLVVSKSTSGGQDWGVHVGTFSSRSEAERALVSVGLAESATLERGLRKVTHASQGYRASFLGLSRDQADLACRRIRARGVDCQAAGPA